MSTLIFALAGVLFSMPAAPAAPDSTGPVPDFSAEAYGNPESLLWPAYFWLWNAPLEESALRLQLHDMVAHGARSVCMLPMPHGFRPDSTNNSMDPDYLTEAYFERVRLAVDEAADLGMNWWLYDEGGWPSGLALGKVVEGHPELSRQRIVREEVPANVPFTVPGEALALVVEQPEAKVLRPGETWTASGEGARAFLYRIASEGASDLMNPDAVRRFLELTHEAYGKVLSPHFGKTIRLTFTDEPGTAMPRPPDFLPWTPGLDQLWQAQTSTPLLNALPELFTAPGKDSSPETARARIELYDLLSRRFADTYFGALEAWGREHGLASGGHLGGEDETLGAVKYSFGHLLRPLRRMDVPGVDLIWRQVFPGQGRQSNFPVAAATAAHQNGTRFAFSESFCVYGNGLTPEQMRWLVDYQYVRGINLIVMGCYPLSTRDHHMTGERPHFGAMNPLWDHLPEFHAYIARLGYALSVGVPKIHTALYYPVRDLWAWGAAAEEAVSTFEDAGAELMARQCAFDLVDDDVLAAADVGGGALIVGPMRYDTIVCGDVRWMAPESLARLEDFAQAGGRVLATGHIPTVDGTMEGNSVAPILSGTIEDLVGQVTPSVRLSPATRNLRTCVRSLEGQEIVMLFNEGEEAYTGVMAAAYPHVQTLDLQRGSMTTQSLDDEEVAVHLGAGESVVYLLSNDRVPAARPGGVPVAALEIRSEDLRVTGIRQYVAGSEDFEIVQPTITPPLPANAGDWNTWLSEDFSGEVDYTATIEIPESWGVSALRLETGPIEYAASVFLDGAPMGSLLWSPWQLDLQNCAPGKHQLVIRVANTLANELTSDRVSQAWAAKMGPGWPSPYHERALVFERESRGGGFTGPLYLRKIGGTEASGN